MKNIPSLLICLCLTVACSSPKKVENQEAAEGPKTSIFISNEMLKKAEISFGKAQITHIHETVQANGMIDVPPQNLASVSTPMAGYVTYTNILPGSKVKKGQVLAVLEHQGFVELQQQYIQSLSRLSLTEKEFDRQKELSVENVSSAKKLQQAESDYKTEKATANALAEKLILIGMKPKEVANGTITSKISVCSPIKGFVKSANVSIGKFISPDFVMFEVVDLEHMHVELKVFEKDVLKVKIGQEVFFTVPTLDNTLIKANIVLLGRTFDNTTRTVGVHGHFDEKKYNFLIPGMYVNGNIIVDERDTYAIPEEAVAKSGEEFVVFAKKSTDAKGTAFEKIPVSLGFKENGKVEIKSPEKIQELEIAATGAYFIQSEMTKTKEED